MQTTQTLEGTKILIPAHHGYYDTTKYPLGGCFRRNGDTPLALTITREFTRTNGCNVSGTTEDGRTVATDWRDALNEAGERMVPLPTFE